MSSDELPPGTVLVVPSPGHRGKYHTDPNCQAVTDRHREWDIDLAKGWDLEECHRCKYEQDGSPHQSHAHQNAIKAAAEDQ